LCRSFWSGRKKLSDGVDIQPGEVYTRLKTARTMPTTSQATVGDMQNAFQELIQQGFDVLGMFMSASFQEQCNRRSRHVRLLELPQKKYMSWIATPLPWPWACPYCRSRALWEAGAGMARLPCIGG